MNVERSAAALCIGVFLAVVPALAHHALLAEFDATQPITLKGKITKVEWVNPHGWLYINVVGPEGKVVSWAIETGNPTGLASRGWKKEYLPVGMEIVVEGYVAKDGTRTANGKNIILPDGRRLTDGPLNGGSLYRDEGRE